MRKYVALSGLAMLATSCIYAGDMGPVEIAPMAYAFFGAEGGYTWNNMNKTTLRIGSGVVNSTTTENSGASARGYAGLMRLIYADSLYFSGEIGWGYYGKSKLLLDVTSIGISSSSTSLSNTVNGFDGLIGLVYNQPKYDIFLKAGALAQKLDLNAGIATRAPLKLSLAQVLPEVKAGAAYHVNKNLSITGAYAHAFGYPPLRLNFGNVIAIKFNSELDMILLGLQYRI